MPNKKKYLLNIEGNLSALDRVLAVCRCARNFQPGELTAVKGPEGYSPWNGENDALSLLNRLESIGVNTGISLHGQQPGTEKMDMEQLEDYVGNVEKQVRSLHDEKLHLAERLRERGAVLEQLQHMKDNFPSLSFEELFSCRYMKIRFGRLPADSLTKLEYYSGKAFVFLPLDKQQDYCWGVYFTTEEYAPETDYIFSALFFEWLPLPDYVHGTPEEEARTLQQEIDRDRTALAYAEEKLQALAREEKERLGKVYALLKRYNDCFPLRKYVYVNGERFYLSGLLGEREREVRSLYRELERIPGIECVYLPYLLQKGVGLPAERKSAGVAR